MFYTSKYLQEQSRPTGKPAVKQLLPWKHVHKAVTESIFKFDVSASPQLWVGFLCTQEQAPLCS